VYATLRGANRGEGTEREKGQREKRKEIWKMEKNEKGQGKGGEERGFASVKIKSLARPCRLYRT